MASLRSPKSLHFSRLNSPSSFSLSSQEKCSIPWCISVAFLRMGSNGSMSPVLRTPLLGTVLHVRSYQCRVERQDQLPCPADTLFFCCSPGYSRLSGLQRHIAGSSPACHPPVPSSPFQQDCAQSFHPAACSGCCNPGTRPCTRIC